MPHVVTRPGRLYGAPLAVLLAVVHGVNDALTAILGALLPALQVRLDVGPATLATLVAVFAISASASQPTLGALADRFGLRRFAAVGVGLAAVSLSLVGVAGSPALLALVLILGGLGSAALHPAAASIVGGPHVAKPGLAVGLFTAGGMAGFAAGPVVVLMLVANQGLEATVWLMIPGVLLAGLLIWLLPDYEPHSIRGTRVSAFERSSVNRRTLALTGVMALTGLVFLTFTSTVPLWLVGERHLATNAPMLGWVLATFSLGAGLGAVVGGVAGPRFGYGTTASVSLLGAGAMFISMLTLPVDWPFLVAAALAGLLLYISQPLLIVAAQEASPAAPTAAAGLVFGGGSGLAGLLYLAVGALQAHLGATAAILVSVSLLLPAAALAISALRPRVDLTLASPDQPDQEPDAVMGYSCSGTTTHPHSER